MNWEIDKGVISQKYFELINLNNLQLFGILKAHIGEARPVLPLIEFIISRLETVVYLSADNRLWDADIIMRSALETFTKFMFITTAPKEEQEKRINEYWYDLPEIASLKLSDQAKRNLEFAGDDEILRLAHLPLVLQDNDEALLRSKWTKAERQKVEQKWSFTEMINWISKSHPNSKNFITLTHSYRMSSHVSHRDETGVTIIKEREGRSEVEREKAEAGHFLRLFSDSLSYCAMVGMDTMMFIKQPKNAEFFFKNCQRISEVDELINRYRGKVYDDPDYDKYRKT